MAAGLLKGSISPHDIIITVALYILKIVNIAAVCHVTVDFREVFLSNIKTCVVTL
jgi:hypothetical protein